MVQADGQRVHGDKIVIAAGSEPVMPPVPGRELAITSDDVLFLPRFPESLVLIGGGVIGLEMAGAFSDLGTRVAGIGRETEIWPALDGDVSAYIRTILEGRGVSFHLGATLERLSGERGVVTAHVRKDGAPLEVTAQQVCLAVGRRYNPRRAGTDAIGLETGRLGLQVDAHLRTSLPHVSAGGDAQLLSSQLSIHPSHGERLIKIFGHDAHEVCEPE